MRFVAAALAALFLGASVLFAEQADESGKHASAALPEALLARAAALRDRALEENQAFDIVRSLTVEVGPRLAGSEGDRAAVAWALTKLRELGFEHIATQPVTVPRWERGDIRVAITEPYPQQLVAAALGGSIGTPASGITAPVIGFENLDELEKTPATKIAGHIVYVGDRMARTQDGSAYGTAVKKRSDGPALAARKGARALLIRSAGTSKARFAHTGGISYEADDPKVPAAALANADADMLEEQLNSGHPVSIHLMLSARELPAERSANVIAELPGSEAGDEIVLLAAHLDSWDLGTGAIDDGAGVAVVIEAARLISELPEAPRRTIRVLLAANEEFGLSGAKAYAAANREQLGNHVIGFEADFGAGRVYQLASRVKASDLELVKAMHAVLAPLGISMGDNQAGGGADLSPMRKLGMAVLAPRQDGSEYFDYHHTADDTLDKIDHQNLNQNVAVYAALALLAADMPARFATREPEADTK